MAAASAAASKQDRPDLYKNQIAQLAEMRAGFNLNAVASGNWNTQQVKAISGTEALTNKIRQQKLTVSDMFRNWKTLQTDVYKEQVALRNSMVTQFGGNMFGNQTLDLHTPKNLGPELDSTKIKYGLITEQIRSAAKNTVNWGKNMQWAGRQITVGIGVPLGIAAVAAGALAYQVDKNLTRVAKVYDTTATTAIGQERELAALRENSLNMATQLSQRYGAAMQNVIDVQAQLASTGLNGADLMRSTSEAVRIATLGELDYQKSVDMTIALQTAFGLSTNELTEAFNFMNSVENATSLSIQDIAEATPRAASALAALGGTVQDMTVMLVAMRESGVDAAEGANAIKSATSRLLNPTAAAVSYFKDTFQIDLASVVDAAGGNIYKIMQDLAGMTEGYDELAKQRGIQELFGTYQFNRVTALWDNLGAAMNDTTGTVNQTSAAMRVAGQDVSQWATVAETEIERWQNSIQGKFKIAMESIKAQLIPLGMTALQVATPIMNVISAIIEGFNSMSPALKGIILGGAGLLAFVGVAGMFVGIMANAVGSTVGFLGAIAQLRYRFKALSPAQAAQNAINRGMASSFNTTAQATSGLAFYVRDLTVALEQAGVAAGTMMSKTGQIAQRQVMQNAAGQHVYAPGSIGASGNRLDGMKASQADQAMFMGRMASQSQQVANNTERTGRAMALASKASAGLMIGGLATTIMADSSNETAQKFGVIATSAGLVLSIVGPGLSSALAKVSVGAAGVGGGFRAIAASTLRVFGPAGLLITGLAIMYKLIDASNEMQEAQQAIADSAQTWMNLGGEGELYQEDPELTNAADGMLAAANAANELKEANEELYNSAGTLTGANDVLNKTLQQGINIIDSGGSYETALNSMRTYIAAAAEQGVISQVEVTRLMLEIQEIDLTNPDEVQGMMRDLISDNLAAINDNSDNFGASDIAGGLGNMLSQAFQGNWDTAELEGDMVQNGFTDEMRAAITNSVALLTEQLNGEIGNTANQANIFQDFTQNMITQQEAAIGRILEGMGQSIDGLNLADVRRRLSQGLSLDGMGLDLNTIQVEMLTDAVDQQQVARQRLIYEIARAHNISEDEAVQIDTMRELMEALGYKVMSVADATAKYASLQAAAAASGHKFSDAMRVQAMESLSAASGMSIMDAAMAGMFGPATRQNLMEIIRLIKMAKQEAAGGLGSGVSAPPVSKMTTTFSDRDSQRSLRDGWRKRLAEEAERAGEARQKALEAAGDATQKSLQAQSKAEDKAFDEREKALDKHWDNVEKITKDRQESETKALEEAYDARTQVIKDQIDREQDAEDQRQKIFEAEERRISRIAARANRNIDFNSALNSGNLDEAAKLYNDSQAETASWAIEDQKDVSKDATELRIEAMNTAIAAIEKEKDARLEALKIVQEAENDANKLRRQAIEDSLKEEREAAKERTQAAQEAARAGTQAAQERARAETAAAVEAANQYVLNGSKAMTTDANNRRAMIPVNQATLATTNEQTRLKTVALSAQLGGIFMGMGNILSGAIAGGADKGKLGALQVDWAGAGNDIAGRIAGTVGLDTNQMKAWLRTGDYPGAGWKKAMSRHEGGMVLHEGGATWSSKDRTGIPRSATLYPSEVPAILKRGEFVVNEKATRNNLPLLRQINSGGGGAEAGDGKMLQGASRVAVKHEGGMWASGAIAAMGGSTGLEAQANRTLLDIEDLTRYKDERETDKGVKSSGDNSYSGPGSGSLKSAITFARQQEGKPYIWGGAGPAGQDCSGFMSIIANWITGQSPKGNAFPWGRRFATGSMAGGVNAGGFVRGGGPSNAFRIGVDPNSHTAGTLGGLNVESGSGHGPMVGKKALGATSNFRYQYYLPAADKLPQLNTGGFIKYDNTLANLHKDESVLTAPLTEKFRQGLNGDVANNKAEGYNITIDMRGATVREEIDINSAVYAAIDEKERKLGRRRVVGG